MDFQVSARKWRPQKFSELIGQEHIAVSYTHLTLPTKLEV